MKTRCTWCLSDPLYMQYHDREWGVPVRQDRKHFEFIILEGAQAGLSWITVLKKRAAYRQVMDGFDFNVIATYKEAKVRQLLKNTAIIRNERKLRSAIKNARAFIEIRREFGTFNSYIWQFVDNKPIQNSHRCTADIPAKTELAAAISKDLKKRGFSFVGPVIVYAHMQATGLVNDHTVDCFRHGEIKALSPNNAVRSR